MLRRYELTDEEWLRIEPLLPPENTGKQGRPRKDNRIIMNLYILCFLFNLSLRRCAYSKEKCR